MVGRLLVSPLLCLDPLSHPAPPTPHPQEHDQGRETPGHYSRATGGRFLEDHEDGELEMASQ